MKYKVILIALATGILLTLLASTNAFYTWNQKLTDGLYGGTPALDNIIIIGIDDKSLQEIGRWPWKRTVWLDLLNNINAKVIAFDIAFYEPTQDDQQLEQALKNSIVAQEYDFESKTMLSPKFIAKTGIVNIYKDQDGSSRSVPTTLQGQPSFAKKIVQEYLGRQIETPEKLLVNYAEPFTTISAIDVINGKITGFENKIVLIGATAPGLHDDYITPTNNRMPGVEIHAHAIQTILTKQYLKHQSFATLAAIILLLALLTGILHSTIRIRYSTTILTAILFAYIITAVFTFKKGIILNLVYPPITILLTSLTTIGYIASHEAKHKKQILTIFGKYVSKDVVTHLLQSEKAVELGGEEKQITAMFADIRGFTAMSEKMTPHQVIEVLNHYFGDMTDLVFANDGTLDKFIGDCLFAIWGTPIEDKQHALKAIRCCLQIQQKLKEKHTKDIPPISLGMGLCSGPAIVGNMGSPQRQEFTAIGDTVNTASRLSGQAQGGEIIISESTYKLVKGKVKVKKLKPVKVKGKEKALQIYEVTGLTRVK